MDSYRKLLVAGVNVLLENKAISLVAEELDTSTDNEDSGHLEADLFGQKSIILWRKASFKELRVSVWWKYNHSKNPHANLLGTEKEEFTYEEPLGGRSKYKNFVGAIASGTIERKNGIYLMGFGREGIECIYTRAGEKISLEKLPIPNPSGFQSEGKYIKLLGV
jgi:hypothetical protein